MWVRLKTVKNFPVRGKMSTFHAGDIVQVGGATARPWLDDGSAELLDFALMEAGKLITEPTAGVILCGGVSQFVRDRLAQVENLQLTGVDPETWRPMLLYTENCLWQPHFELRLDPMLHGFHLLKRWQMAVPLVDYETLAVSVGSVEERQYTERIVRDLRVLLRDTRLVFIRRCPAMLRFVEQWQIERERFGSHTDERLAFLRAVYTERPLVCDLPNTWTGQRA
jgi:hypothetical protein